MVCSLIDHRNDVIKCTQVLRVWTMENCGRFVFYSNICCCCCCFFFTRNQKQNNQHCVTCYVISMVYALIDHS